ncbi:hypothetical protein BET10_11710 [Pseudoalteromonas amylolytica]|uniref:Polymer-forming cytoskeletal protein n=2 Tax=Pseudoalteromonas TaxID=53246 RepID=A0A1S1MS91_9GAMM|nr:hypothetical protein BFC16_11590 [Pseudoalteromonas sp. JW3]OHU91470.1 hypothetical protein BET10_11710 [Pseudoalteromonas amylolytica]
MKYLAILLAAFLSTVVNAATSSSCPNEEGYFYTNDRDTRNPSQGGFVSHDADISDNIWLGKNAAICGFATVSNRARITGRAIVCGDAVVTGSKARVTGHAKVCGNARIDGSKRDVVMKGYFEAYSGLFDAGVHSADKKANKKTNKEHISEFINSVNNFSSTVYLFAGETKRMISQSSFQAYQDNIKDSCEIVLSEISTNKALRDGKVAVWPKENMTSRFNLRDLEVNGLTISGSRFDRNHFDMFQFSINLRNDQGFEAFAKKQNSSGKWVNKREQLSGYWFHSEKKAALQNLRASFVSAVRACK